MKMVIAVVKPFVLETVRAALSDIGVEGMTVSEVKGYGRQKGHTEIYRGAEYQVYFLPKVKLELVVADDQAEAVVAAISQVANNGQIGAGKIFVMDVLDVVRVRTGERGAAAI
jgi:nitrogen regulatory protein P-II 2